MIFDKRRVNAYKRAIDVTVKEGDIVIDVGAGTGLLTFLSLKRSIKSSCDRENFSNKLGKEIG